MRISLRPTDEGYRGEQYPYHSVRVWLDGVDVGHHCMTADSDTGIVWMLKVDKNLIVQRIDGVMLQTCKFGEVVIEAWIPRTADQCDTTGM